MSRNILIYGTTLGCHLNILRYGALMGRTSPGDTGSLWELQLNDDQSEVLSVVKILSNLAAPHGMTVACDGTLFFTGFGNHKPGLCAYDPFTRKLYTIGLRGDRSKFYWNVDVSHDGKNILVTHVF